MKMSANVTTETLTKPVPGTVREYCPNPDNRQHLAPGVQCQFHGCEVVLNDLPAYYRDTTTFYAPGGGYGVSFGYLCEDHGKVGLGDLPLPEGESRAVKNVRYYDAPGVNRRVPTPEDIERVITETPLFDLCAALDDLRDAGASESALADAARRLQEQASGLAARAAYAEGLGNMVSHDRSVATYNKVLATCRKACGWAVTTQIRF